MAYRVISPFADLQDKSKDFPDGRIYAIGDTFPAEKRKVSAERIEMLLSSKNSIGRAVIEEITEGVDANGSRDSSTTGKGKSRNKK